MAKGDVVLAKASSGEPIVRRVWSEDGGKISVTLEDYYKRWQNQKVDPWVFALAKANVFHHDAKLFEQLETAYKQKRKGDDVSAAHLGKLWAQAKPYSK